MQKQYRLQKNKQFQFVYRRGKSVSSKNLVLIYHQNRQVKVGFSISKKVGNAVVRNKLKRQLRECVRPMLGSLKPGHYIILARNSAASASFSRLKEDLSYLLKKQNLLLPPLKEHVPL